MIGVPGPRQVKLADFTRMKRFHGLNHPGPTAPLIAHLDDALMFAGRSNDQLAFMRIMTARFLDIDVFAGRAGQNRSRRMPMVGNSDGDSVHVFVLEDAPKIFYSLRFAFLLFEREGDAVVNGPAVHVADVGDFDVRLAEMTIDVIFASAITTDDAKNDFVIGTFCSAKRAGTERGYASGKNGRLLEKIAASKGDVHGTHGEGYRPKA